MNRRAGSERGFTLIEVLVALIIIGVGMLGIAKIQALAYASTGTASQRSLASIEAASLAAAMRANRAYWTAPATPLTVTVTTGITTTDGSIAGGTVNQCLNNAACTAANVAASDLANWKTAINAVLPTPTGTISCPTPVAVSGVTPPVACTISLTWFERNVGINAQSQVNGQGNAMVTRAYSLYVVP
jgi:type IV pilus assembly protein PilV